MNLAVMLVLATSYGPVFPAPNPCTGTAVLQWNGTAFVCGVAIVAPIDAEYVTYSANATLTAERVLTSGTNTTVDLGTSGQAKVNLSGTVPQSLGGTGAGALTCTSGQALTSNGSVYACTSTITASSVTGSNVSGAVATATALAANPADCSANQFATTIAANGDLTCAQPSFTNLSGTASATQLGVKRIVTTNATNSTVTPATTGLSWAVAANTEYGFTCVLTTQGTATSLPRFNLNGPASPTTVAFTTQRYTTTAAQTLLVLQAFSAAAQTVACTASCNATVLPTLIAGTIINGANAGTADLQFASSTAAQTVTVFRGSYCQIF